MDRMLDEAAGGEVLRLRRGFGLASEGLAEGGPLGSGAALRALVRLGSGLIPKQAQAGGQGFVPAELGGSSSSGKAAGCT